MGQRGNGNKKGERGVSTIGIALVVGVVVIALGIAVLMSTDTQVHLSFLDQIQRNSDWTVRSAVKLVEEAWKKYIAVTSVPNNPYEFTGTVYNAVKLLSRDTDLIWAIDQNQDQYSLLPLTFDWMVQNNKTNLDVKTGVPHPNQYTFQVDLRPAGVSTDSDGDGIVPYDPTKQQQIWNSLDNNNTRQFNVIITVKPNGLPHYSDDNSNYIFPVKFDMMLTARNIGPNGLPVDKKVMGRGSCAFYLGRRSFAEYVMFANKFTTETGTDIQLPKDFTYGGPVHTNTHFYFTGNPSTTFLDVVTQHEQMAAFGSSNYLLNKDMAVNPPDSYTVIPTFKKKFYRGVSEIPLPPGYGDVKGGVLNNRPIPTTTGVDLPVSSDDKNIVQGGIYIKGDVKSLELQEADRKQTYIITQQINKISGPTTVNTYNNGTQNKSTQWIETITTVTKDTIYTITCDYNANLTNYEKKTVQTTQTLTNVYTRKTTYSSWEFQPSLSTTATTSTILSVDKSTIYSGVIDAVVDKGDENKTAQERRKQPAIYIEGNLGVTGSHQFQGGGYPQTAAPTGLSGRLDKDTELTICASGSVVISGDVRYETQPTTQDKSDIINDKNILGILSETGQVCIDYDQPYGRNVNIDASIMATSDDPYDTNKKGVLKAYDYQINVGSPTINLWGGVVQAYYGAVGTTSGGGYIRTFLYDRRLKTSPPPLYPKQAGCSMQLTNKNDKNSLYLIWEY